MRLHLFGRLVFAAALLLFFFSVPSAKASEDMGWYFGLGYGATEIENDYVLYVYPGLTGIGFDERDYGYKIFGGCRLSRFVSVEASYADFGELLLWGGKGSLFISKGRLWTPAINNTFVTVTAKAVALSTVLRLPFDTFTNIRFLKNLSPLFKIGGHYRQVEVEVTPNSGLGELAEKDRDIDWCYGAGLEYDISRHFGFRFEYEHYNFQKVVAEDVDFISASILVQF